MENISAVYAVEWSNEFEKGIRSKTPGRQLEVIRQLGPRLVQWNREPELTIIEYNIFGLIPGEDNLFANTILFRLAEVFKSGDNNIRASIVRIFLSMLRDSSMNDTKKKRIFSKLKITHKRELLARIKTVLANRDVEAKALAVVLFGCWADFSVDSADIRYLILSGLVSFNDLEVKASLFALGRFCTFSDDFASVVLEMLPSILRSSEISLSIRLAGVRIFANLDCSFPLATKFFQIGKNLVLESLEEDVLFSLLISLTKFASLSTFLMSEQVDLLFRFLTPDATLHVKEITLKCLCFLFQRGVHCSSYSTFIKTLFCLLDASELPLSSQCDALQILLEILIYKFHSPPNVDLIDVPKLIKIVENPNNVYIFSLRVTAIRVVLALSDMFKREKIPEDGVCTTHPLQLHLISVIFDRINLVVKITLDSHLTDFVMEQEIKNLLKLYLLLINHHPDMNVFVMDRIISLVECLINAAYDNDKGTLKGTLQVIVIEKILFYVYKFVMACLEALTFDTQIFNKAKFVAELVCRCNLFDSYTHSIYFLLLNSDCVAEQEVGSLECAEELVRGNSYWLAYRVGRYAACQGAWRTAALIFGKLKTVVKLDSCYGKWLKSLALFCDCEMEFKSLLPNREPTFLERNKIFLSFSEKLTVVCAFIRSSREALGSTSFQIFCFQNWLLSLRGRFLETVMDALKLLGSVPKFLGQVGAGSTLYRLFQISLRLKRLALEYDLVSASFDMDKKSSKIISALALECSVLAFGIGFAVYTPGCGGLFADASEKLESDSQAILLVQDLIERLWDSDSEGSENLRLLLLNIREGSRELAPKNEIVCEGSHDALNVCRFAVGEIVGLRNERGGGVDDEKTPPPHAKGFNALFGVIEKWMRIPFKCPKYFFRARDCMGSKIFVLKKRERGGEEAGDSGGMLRVLRGSYLSVDVCLEPKNTGLLDVQESYCILHFRESFLVKAGGPAEAEGVGGFGFEELVDLNEKLSGYVKSKGCGKKLKCEGDGFAFVEFGGGKFSTCLLDVSAFPLGSYAIKWHGCFIDRLGHYHSLLPFNHAPVFTVVDPLLYSCSLESNLG